MHGSYRVHTYNIKHAYMQILALHVIFLDMDGYIGRKQLHIICVAPIMCIVHVHVMSNMHTMQWYSANITNIPYKRQR